MCGYDGVSMWVFVLDQICVLMDMSYQVHKVGLCVHGVYRCVHMCVHVYACVFSKERVHSFVQIFNKILTLQNSNNSYFSPSLCVDKKQAP